MNNFFKNFNRIVYTVLCSFCSLNYLSFFCNTANTSKLNSEKIFKSSNFSVPDTICCVNATDTIIMGERVTINFYEQKLIPIVT